MPIAINGTGTITGISAGGLPDDCITTAEIAGSAVTTAKLAQPMTLAAATASTSGTAIDFTGIPSWAKRITVMFSGISLSGTDHFLAQIGSGSITSSGYSSTFSYLATDTSANSTTSTSGFGIWGAFAGGSTHGNMHIMLLNSSSFLYASSHSAGEFVGPASKLGGGSVTLGGLLDRVRITRTGSDTFDAGSINIMYEG
jgi:hypothetical protein